MLLKKLSEQQGRNDGMNGKTMVAGWMMGGFAILVMAYITTQFMSYMNSFKLM